MVQTKRGRPKKDLVVEKGDLIYNDDLKNEVDRNIFEDKQSDELALALGLSYDTSEVVPEIRKPESQKEIAAIDDLSKLPKDEEERNKDIGDVAIRVVEIRKSENQKEIAAIDDLSKLPKDEEEGNKDIVDAAIRVVEVLKKNKYRAKVSKKNRLAFPKMKFYRCLRRMTRLRVADAASVFMAAIVRYLVEEVFSLAHDCMVRQKRKRITPQHIGMGVRIDDELGQLFRGITIPSAGRFGTYYLTH